MRARAAAFATPALWTTLSWRGGAAQCPRVAFSTRARTRARNVVGEVRTARMLARQQLDSKGREYIRLDGFLKLNAMVETGGEAKLRIQQGDVWVNGAVEMRRGRKLRQGDVVQLEELAYEVEFIADGAEVAGGNWA